MIWSRLFSKFCFSHSAGSIVFVKIVLFGSISSFLGRQTVWSAIFPITVGLECIMLVQILLIPNMVKLARSMSHHIINRLKFINNHARMRFTTFLPISFEAQLFTISQIIENTIHTNKKLLILLNITRHLKRKSVIPNTSQVARALLIILPVRFAIGIRIRESRLVKNIANWVVLESDSLLTEVEVCAKTKLLVNNKQQEHSI